MPNQIPSDPVPHYVVAASMIVLSFAVLASLYSNHSWPIDVAVFAFAALALTGHHFYGRREQFLLALAVVLTGAVYIWAPDPITLLTSAFERAAFLAAFMILLALLREGAVTSPAVLEVGSYLTRQPPSRRYLSIHLGSHLLAIFLNFGALNLLGPLIMRGIADSTPDPDIAAIRRERQISALLRGFAWMVAWSPTAITQALVYAVVPGVEPARMLLIGLILVVLTTAVGWGLDSYRGIKARRVIPASARRQFTNSEPFPKLAFWNFATVCFCLVASTIVAILAFGVTTIPALMLVAPIVTTAWIMRQFSGRADMATLVLGRLKSVVGQSMPRGTPEAVTLACAGYCGLCAAGLIDPQWFADRFQLAQWHEFAIYCAAMLLPVLLSNVGLPPLMVITFFGTLLSAIPGLHFDPTLLAMGFCVGWALNLTGSPFGISAVILARMTGIKGRELTWSWNGSYSLITLLLSATVLVVFAYR